MTLLFPPSRRSLGFTLVEVLAALALAAIILPVAMRGVSLATAASGDARRRLEAAALAEAKLAELVATGEWQTADLSGDCGPDWPGFRWAADVSEWEGVAALREVTVHVEWTARARQRSVTLSTLVYSGSQ